MSLTYNIGPTALRNSTLRQKILRGDLIKEGDFTEYHYSGGRPIPGLLNRRRDEYHLFSKR